MKYYFLLIAAVILGQTFTGCVSAWYYQRKNEAIGYGKALKVYFHKEIGTFAVIISFTLLVLFALSDWMDLTKTRAELLAKGELTKFEQAQKFFRTVAVIYGVFAQWAALYFFKKGKNAIEDYGKKEGVNLNELK